jgi:anaphase-promoting complex subunit 1
VSQVGRSTGVTDDSSSKDNNHLDLLSILQHKVIFVKRKTGFLSYKDDPKGYRSILSRSYPKDSHLHYHNNSSQQQLATSDRNQKHNRDFISAFSADPSILAFAQLFCTTSHSSTNNNHHDASGFYTSVLYECLTQEKPEMVGTYLSLYHTVNNMCSEPNPLAMSNVKLIMAFYSSNTNALWQQQHSPLISLSFLETLRNAIEKTFSDLQMKSYWPQFLQGTGNEGITANRSVSMKDRLFRCYLCFSGIPHALAIVKHAATGAGVAILEDEDLLYPWVALALLKTNNSACSTEAIQEITKLCVKLSSHHK